MASVLEVNSNDDMPCNDWHNDSKDNCPMKEKWHEGEVICCYLCGNLIGYNTDDKGY